MPFVKQKAKEWKQKKKLEKEKKELAKNQAADKKTDASKPKELQTPLMNQAEIESNMPEYEVGQTTPTPPSRVRGR